MKRKKTLGKQILRAMLSVVFVALLVAGIIFAATMKNIQNRTSDSNRRLSDLTGKKSSASMREVTEKRMLELAAEKADLADAQFADFKRAVTIVAYVADGIYSHPDNYEERPVDLPDPEKDGLLTAQVLYSASTDPEDPKIKEELGLLGNIQDVLIAVNGNLENVASIYVATESGFMVQADYISARKFDEDGNLMPLEAKERPWYQGAAKTREIYLTPVTRDAHTPRLGIMCGAPVYTNGLFKGVAGAGMYLDDMDELVQSVDLGGKGYACIINQKGQILFSGSESGSLAVHERGGDIRTSEDKELAELAVKAVKGETGVMLLPIDEKPCYVAYAPLKTVGWSMMVIQPQAEVEAPTEELLKSLELITEQTWREANADIRKAMYYLFGLIGLTVLIAAAVAILVSHNIVKPIRKLTDTVQNMKGDNLDFTWEKTNQHETQTLAESFDSMTERVRTYIQDIKSITASQERINTELALAQRIQAAMLPSSFPPFPDRTEFDIYAIMDPAREVGGDFYDFFLIDDDHLCLVIADVSGKGVPAALFMMISKTILQIQAKQDPSPAAILSAVNKLISANNTEDMFITVWVGILEISTGRLTAANAGHEYPVMKKPDGGFELIKDRHGFVVGGFAESVYREYELLLEPGSKLFLYTDGLPEAKGSGDKDEMFGTDRMLDTLNTAAKESPDQILNTVRKAVNDFVQSAEQFDDLTMLCLEYKGRGE